MIRDFTMIVAVLVAIVSAVFGIYKNIEANNAKGFAYEQAYRIIAAIGGSRQATATALSALRTPPPVIDLSRSSADTATQQPACTAVQVATCVQLAEELARASTPELAATLKNDIVAHACVACFAP